MKSNIWVCLAHLAPQSSRVNKEKHIIKELCDNHGWNHLNLNLKNSSWAYEVLTIQCRKCTKILRKCESIISLSLVGKHHLINFPLAYMIPVCFLNPYTFLQKRIVYVVLPLLFHIRAYSLLSYHYIFLLFYNSIMTIKHYVILNVIAYFYLNSSAIYKFSV